MDERNRSDGAPGGACLSPKYWSSAKKYWSEASEKRTPPGLKALGEFVFPRIGTAGFEPAAPSTCLGFSRLGHARLPLPGEVRDNTQQPLDQHDLAAVMHLVLLHR